jgi:hypothetical protein
MNTTMAKRIPSIPKGATGVYRSEGVEESMKSATAHTAVPI